MFRPPANDILRDTAEVILVGEPQAVFWFWGSGQKDPVDHGFAKGCAVHKVHQKNNGQE